MYSTLHIVPSKNAFLLSVGDAGGKGGAVPSSTFSTLEDLAASLRSVGIPDKTIRLMESTLKGGLAFTVPGVDLLKKDLLKLGIR
jgi:hypothetical protein